MDSSSAVRNGTASVFSPVLVAPGPDILHGCEAARDAGKAVEVVHDGAACLQVIRVSCRL